MVSIFSSVINLLGKTESVIVSLELAVMHNSTFVKCLKISAEKSGVDLYFLGLGQGN